MPHEFVQNESVANLTVVILDANDNAPTWHNYDRLRRKHSSMESEGVPMGDGKENINSVIPTYTVKGKMSINRKRMNISKRLHLYQLCSTYSQTKFG